MYNTNAKDWEFNLAVLQQPEPMVIKWLVFAFAFNIEAHTP